MTTIFVSAALGRTKRAKGGIARAAALSDERKKEIAKKAALTRWGNRPPRATHKGNFKDEFGIDVECYVLDDEQKTAVLSERGMGATLGFSPNSGGRFPAFVSGKIISPYLGRELKEKLEKPLIFQGPPAAAGSPPIAVVHGYDVTLLIDVCKAIITAEADDKLMAHQKGIAKQAHIILNASAKAGIKGLVYALTGYDATKEEVIAAFKFYVREEGAREYEKEFRDELYRQWYRLYELPQPERNKPWKFKHLTIKQVYYPLAKSNGSILQLLKALRASSGERSKKLHQFLAEIGVKALRTHLGRLEGIAELSHNSEEYEKNFKKIFGEQQEFDFGD